MKNISLMPLDTFTVINRTVLNDRDRSILIMLYQPIIGSTSINLYLNLWSLLDRIEVMSKTLNHKNLISLMGISLKELLESREKLEGVGLIKTYLKEGEINDYVYELYSPLQVSEFFNNPILNTCLYTSVGSIEYKRIKESFKIPSSNLKDYENISRKFSDIFKTDALMDVDTTGIVKKNYAHLGIASNIDVDDLLENIPDIMLNHTKVSDTTKDLIIKLAYVYNFSKEQTLDIINNSINEKHNIDTNLLRNNFSNYFTFEHGGNLPSIMFKTQPDGLKKEITSTSPKARMIYKFENTSPYNYLCMKSKSKKPTPSELDIVAYLLVDIGLLPGVVNVLIDYVLKINNNKLTKNFITAIASQWKRSNIRTVEEAIKIAKEEQTKKVETPKVIKVTKKEETPEWFDKEIEKGKDEEKISKMKAMLRGE